MRILLTGACGFIGSHFVEAILKTTTWEVVALDRIDETSTLERLRGLDAYRAHKDRLAFVWHDLRAPINAAVSGALGPIDLVLHLAASTHVDRSITDPGGFVADNVIGTMHVMDWARAQSSPPLVVHFSTDEVFGHAPDGVSYTEDSPFRPGNPYSASKAGAVVLGESYANTYGLPLVTTFCMNVIGERQHPEKFLPLLVRKIFRGEPVTIHADKTRTRPARRSYIHARNVWNAVRFLIDSYCSTDVPIVRGGERVNITGHAELDCVELGERVALLLGVPWRYELVDFHSSRPGHDLRYALDGSKLARWGFVQPVSFEDSLARTVEWYMANPEWLAV